MDYHSLGFRECASEVARYLVSIEGLDLQDPLRLRMMSHLQCYSAQRDLAQKQAQTSWGFPHPTPPPPPPVPNYSNPAQSYTNTLIPQATSLDNTLSSNPNMSAFTATQNIDVVGNSLYNPLAVTSSSSSSQFPVTSQRQSTVCSTTAVPSSGVSPASQYHLNINTASYPSNMGGHGTYSPGTQVKPSPYRPWGSELAY